MTYRPPRRRSRVPTLNLTPLIDIVFLLIVFFMLATSFLDRDYIPLGFPAPSAETSPNALRAEILTPQEIRLDGDILSLPAFARALGRIADGETSILLVASRSIDLQDVVAVIDLIRASGIDAIAVKPTPPSTP